MEPNPESTLICVHKVANMATYNKLKSIDWYVTGSINFPTYNTSLPSFFLFIHRQ